MVASVTPTLRAEIAMMGWTLEPLGGGYRRIGGAVYTVYVAVTDEVSQAEKDEFLALFSHARATQGEATRWLEQWLTEKKMKQQDIEEVPGYKEVFQKLLQALPLEQRLAGLAPEQRLAGLTPEQQLLALSDEVLRSLPDEYLRSLPDTLREIIHVRIGRPSSP